VIELDRDPATGKRKQKWVSGFRTRDEAEKELRARLRKIDEGDDPFPVDVTVKSWADSWLDFLWAQGRLRRGTIRNYDALMRDHVVPSIGSMQMRKVRTAHCQGVLDRMSADGKAPRTVAHCRAAMSGMFRHAVRMDVLKANPVRDTQPPGKSVPQLITPTTDDLAKIMAAAEGTIWEVPVMLAATIGARRGEVLGIQWGNVDLDAGRVRIVDQVQKVDGKLVRVPPKTARGVRTVPLLPWVVERLRQHRLEQLDRLSEVGGWPTPDTPVCDRGDGQPIDPSTFTHAAKRITKQAGCEGVRLHDLRHGVATALAENRNRAELTSKVLGHASVAFTLDRYTHPRDEELDEVSAVLGRAFRKLG
jgi:integrase